MTLDALKRNDRSLALAAAGAITLGGLLAGCQQQAPPAREPEIVEPLAVDEPILRRDWPPSAAYYADGQVVAGADRSPFEPPHDAAPYAQTILEPVYFFGNVLYLPFSYIFQPPFAAEIYEGIEVEPTYTAVPPLPPERDAAPDVGALPDPITAPGDDAGAAPRTDQVPPEAMEDSEFEVPGGTEPPATPDPEGPGPGADDTGADLEQPLPETGIESQDDAAPLDPTAPDATAPDPTDPGAGVAPDAGEGPIEADSVQPEADQDGSVNDDAAIEGTDAAPGADGSSPVDLAGDLNK